MAPAPVARKTVRRLKLFAMKPFTSLLLTSRVGQGTPRDAEAECYRIQRLRRRSSAARLQALAKGEVAEA